MSELLYKVSAPREPWTFEPRRFWRSEDWSCSDDQALDGLIEDCVLYAAEFDAVNIHLLPKVWRLRVWLDDADRCARLRALGYTWRAGTRALIFALERDRDAIESFSPTVYAFERSGFAQTPTDEFVAREPRTAVSAATIPFAEARHRWQVEVVYVIDPDALAQALRTARVDHQIQA